MNEDNKMASKTFIRGEDGKYVEVSPVVFDAFEDYAREIYNLRFRLGYKNKQLKRVSKRIRKEQDKLYRIRKYLEDKNYLNVGYFQENEEGNDIFIDVKNDILNIIKEER